VTALQHHSERLKNSKSLRIGVTKTTCLEVVV